jgi:hypothetical protein
MPTETGDGRAVRRVADVLSGFARPWFVAGDRAIDCFLGEKTRPRSGVEVAVFRDDQFALAGRLSGWFFEKVVPEDRGRIEPWREGEYLSAPVYKLRARGPGDDPDRLVFLLNDRDGDEWIYRRNETVRRELSKAGLRTDAGVPYLAPELVLLERAPTFDAEDERDFEAVAPRLPEERRAWLAGALERTDPNHPWLAALRTLGDDGETRAPNGEVGAPDEGSDT